MAVFGTLSANILILSHSAVTHTVPAALQTRTTDSNPKHLAFGAGLPTPPKPPTEGLRFSFLYRERQLNGNAVFATVWICRMVKCRGIKRTVGVQASVCLSGSKSNLELQVCGWEWTRRRGDLSVGRFGGVRRPAPNGDSRPARNSEPTRDQGVPRTWSPRHGRVYGDN